MHLKGKAALVTGAGRGIGRDIALLLAREGASVVVNDPGLGREGQVTEERPADDVVAEIQKAGGKALAAYHSVADYVKAGSMIKQCVDAFGKIDILVNTAGMLRERMIWNMSEDDWDAVISVHLKGHWNMSHHAIKYMRNAGHGRIVNFSSDAFKGGPGQSNYVAAKAGIIGLTKAIAHECAKYGITANAICPMADTRMILTPTVLGNRKRRLETGQMTQKEYDRIMAGRGPEHIAPIVAYLATDDAYYINGQIFHAEKGMIGTYYYGEDRKQIFNDGEVFTVAELVERIPATLMNGVTPLVPVVEMKDAQRGSEAKKAG
jgi:NAD(P)-dependent dehydrogenase (short-subunit alcohol dehydrogenase family)